MKAAVRPRWDDDVDLDRTFVVLPAVMGVGLLCSLATVARDAARALSGHSGPTRRAALAGATTALAVVAPGAPAVGRLLRSRTAVTAVAAAAVALSALLLGGTTWARLSTGDGHLPTWLWALALAAGTGAAAVGGTCTEAAVRWDDPPPAAFPLLRALSATASPPAASADPVAARFARRRRALWRWLLPVGAAAAADTVYVAVADTRRVDDLLLRAVGPVDDLGPLAALDPLGGNEVAVGLSLLVGIATWRCRPFAVTYVVSALSGWALYEALGALVVRVRPDSPTMRTDSYPSGHVLQGTVLAGLVSLALAVLLRRRWVDPAVAAILGSGVAAVAVARVLATDHWPLDVVGSALIGVTLVLAVHLVLARPALHTRCRDCLWHPRDRSGQPSRSPVG